MRARFPVTPRRYLTIAYVALAALTVIVLTGAAVRLTDSGLGCPDWPRCYGKVVPPLSFHSVIEFGNRVFSAGIGLVVVGAWLASFLRTPRRRDLTVLSTLLPLGVVGQAVLGGFTVRHDLAPGYVMGHFGLSMVILIAAVALVFRARVPDAAPAAAPPRSHDRLTVWLVRVLAAYGAVVIFVGTAATAAGPHAGGSRGQLIHRLHFKGVHTLVWTVHRHATLAALLGLGVIAAWFLARRRAAANRELGDALMVTGILMAAQGLVGSVQYELALPADMVWVHVTLATVTWVALLWCVGAAGRLAPRGERPPLPAGDASAVPHAEQPPVGALARR
ncbi:MAG TPA: COX15/CtaA family protein [Conexibacter sp.]|nr:COX15/CtaA family protein [Conexibacter sp.]